MMQAIRFQTLALGLFVLVSLPIPISARELDLGAPTSRTPYDSYLQPVWDVFKELGAQDPDRAVVNRLVRQGRAFFYSFKKEEPWVPQLPEKTEATKTGDCKAKSLWLASKINSKNLRFVVGKAKVGDPMSHAWLLWKSPSGWLVLDPTSYGNPLEPSRLSATQLVPTYSYSPSGKFVHTPQVKAANSRYSDHL